MRPNTIFAGALGIAVAAACASPNGDSIDIGSNNNVGGDGGANDGAPGPGPIPFEATAPEAYVAKVKDVLVGLPPTDAEVAAVKADPTALKGLIDQWMKLPQYQTKMIAFFMKAFQQSQITMADFVDQLPPPVNDRPVAARLLENVRESFARTAWQLVSEGKPFTDTVTTNRFMLTPPLMALYAFLDDEHVDDNLKAQSRTLQANPNFGFTVEASAGPIAITDTLNPQSPNYMHWYNALLGTDANAGCNADPRDYAKDAVDLFRLIFGELPPMNINGTRCAVGGASSATAQLADAEFDQWKMITIRPPKATETATAFYDLPTLRTASELVLKIPRLGFFSTPAFFAGWNTNSSNQARVTMNQTLIVALGHAFDGADTITPIAEPGLDPAHAGPSTPCYGCHQSLDPMRQFFRQAYTIAFHDQLDPKQSVLNGVFAFDGVTVQGNGIGDLATQLAKHPRFAQAWAQKLCYYINSAPCSVDDPELLRIATAFQSSNFQWNTLVRELASSPITTGASETKTWDDNQGQTIAIARRDHLCAALAERLGIADPCGQSTVTKLSAMQAQAAVITSDMPADGYSRGSTAPALANDPTLFFRAGVENLCRIVADQVVDAGATSKYTSAQAPDAIADFVHNVMALTTNDPRANDALAILNDHFNNAKAQGASATDALKSTFVLACMAPSAVGIGL